jgi:CheY-like chemotaxis protein
MHNGRMEVFSEGIGKGSSFFIDIPIFHNDELPANKSIMSKNQIIPTVLQTINDEDASPIGTNILKYTVNRNDVENLDNVNTPRLSHCKQSSILNENRKTNQDDKGFTIQNKNLPNKIERLSPCAYTCYDVNNQNEILRDGKKNQNQSLRNEDQIVISMWESGLKFLIVDDSLSFRKMTVKMLSSLGHSVDQAIDGIEFLSKLNINVLNGIYQFKAPFPDYDVILLDNNMPNLCGPQAVMIAREKGYKGLIFGVTGNVNKDQVDEFLFGGADRVFPKPLTIDDLKTALSTANNV